MKKAFMSGSFIYFISTIIFYILGRFKLLTLHIKNGSLESKYYVNIFGIILLIALVALVTFNFLKNSEENSYKDKIYISVGGVSYTIIFSLILRLINRVLNPYEFLAAEYPRLQGNNIFFQKYNLSNYFNSSCQGDGLFKSYLNGGLLGSSLYYSYIIIGIIIGTAVFFMISYLKKLNIIKDNTNNEDTNTTDTNTDNSNGNITDPNE